MSSATCGKIKALAPLRTVAALLGITLPSDGVKFSSPFRRDLSPSCTVKGNHFTDWSRGDHLDQIDFYSAAKGLSRKEAILELARVLHVETDFSRRVPKLTHQGGGEPATTKAEKRAKWPVFEKPSMEEIRAIAELRGLGVEGLQIAAERGLLFCTTDRGSRSWAVTDAERVNARIRPLDGGLWYGKHKTLPPTGGGQDSSWPVGIHEAQTFSTLIMVEGEGDLLAAYHLLWCANMESRSGVVAMLGAMGKISEQALPLFHGKRVRIFEDNDTAGEQAARRWAQQLISAGAAVDSFSFLGLSRANGKPVKDMSDFVHICPDQWETERSRIGSAFNFGILEASRSKNQAP